MFRWTDEARQRLKDLRAIGVTSSKIARELGCTRNAVIGCANRMGLERIRPSTKERKPPAKANKVCQFRPGKRLKATLPKATPMPIEPLNVSLLELRDDQCRSVEGKGEDGLAVYCGHPQTEKSSYCAFHSRVYEHLYVAPRKQGYFRFPGRAA